MKSDLKNMLKGPGNSIRPPKGPSPTLLYRFGLIFGFVVVYIFVGLYFRAVLEIQIVYTHFAYIPIVIAGIWWGRKAVILAALFGLINISFHIAGIGAGGLSGDLMRIIFLLAVAVLVGLLTEKRRQAEKKRKNLQELARKQEEQLLHSARLAELGEMEVAITHEVNQPLTSIRNFAKNALYMIDEDAGDIDEVRENLHLISDQVDRASRIISQMREITRKKDRELAAVNINSIIQESVEFIKPQLELSSIETNLQLARELPKVIGDRIRLAQVFLNILANANQAMLESEERRLVVETSLTDGKERHVVISIADTGRGFDSAQSDRLFRPFYTTKKSGQGTGLGLSISRSIIKDHKGFLEAVGTPGAGACFTIRLPVPGEEDIMELADETN